MAAETAPSRRFSPRRLYLALLLLGIVAVAAAALVVPRLLRRGPAIVEKANAIGKLERCTSCHPDGASGGEENRRPHPRIEGHEDLALIGCTPCHGGAGHARDERAHEPVVGKGADPFLPAGHRVVGCARCHVIAGGQAGMEQLARGQQLFTSLSCPGCHRPGSHPQAIGFDLPSLAQRSPEELRALLLNPRERLPKATMWSLHDATYGDLFAEGTPEGKSNLRALLSYVLMLGDHPQRQALAAAWYRPKVRIDRPCVECHAPAASKATGRPHRCPQLAGNAALRCEACHSADDPPVAADALCPQIRAALFRCRSCHLRDGDGAKKLAARALAVMGHKP